jgi:hypothetical protein
MSANLVRVAERYQAMRSFLDNLLKSQPTEVLRQVLDPELLDQLLHETPPIGLGTAAAAADLPQCALLWNSASTQPIGSGVLVAPDLVLSAAHVEFDIHPDRVSLAIADASDRGETAVVPTPCKVTPGPWGIVLFHLPAGTTSKLKLDPVTAATTAEIDALRDGGGAVRLYGFGYGRTSAGIELPDRVKRYLDHVPVLPDTAELAAEIPNYDRTAMLVVGALGSSAPFGIACSGDSGGPAMATIDGVQKLVGIIESTGTGLGSLPAECGYATMAALARADQTLTCQ